MVDREEDDPRDGGLVKKRGRRGKGEKEEREGGERGRERERERGERERLRKREEKKEGEKEKNNEERGVAERDNVIAHNKQEKMSCEVSHANTAWECYQTNRQSHTNHGKH